jgi:hypothetical protein
MVEINLSDQEFKLLLMILREAEDQRADMGCNDPYKKEQKLFTKAERIEMQRQMNPDEPEEDLDGFLFNCQYVEYIIDKIKDRCSVS